MPLIPSKRSEAKALGLEVFASSWCPRRGHGNLRLVSNGKCQACKLEADQIRMDMVKKVSQELRQQALKQARRDIEREVK